MATNIIYDKIFKGLQAVLGRNTVVMGDQLPRSAEYVQLSLESEPELIENTGASYAMRYTVNIDLITNRAKKPKYLTQALSDIRNDLNTNTAYSPSGVYHWHDGQTLTSETGDALDENEKQMYAARIIWAATHTEVRS
jgi:hypothetical protein